MSSFHLPTGANGRASHHCAGPNHPGGRYNTAFFPYHHPITHCDPDVTIHKAALNLRLKEDFEDAIEVSGGYKRKEMGSFVREDDSTHR